MITAMQPTIIIIGNEKGGTGKSTVAMHLSTYLLKMDYQVATIDLDARQGTLTRYVDNRKATLNSKNYNLKVSTHTPLHKSTNSNLEAAQQTDHENFTNLLQQLNDHHFIIIDTPGSDQYLSRLAHSYADILITPLNDSFVDLDMLAVVNGMTGEVVRPSTYCEMVWEQKKQRALRRLPATTWIVLRNRLSMLHSKNRHEMQIALQNLGKRVGFRPIVGFSERVIFRELFSKGLTVLDLEDAEVEMSLSHIAAKQELQDLIVALGLDELTHKLDIQRAANF